MANGSIVVGDIFSAELRAEPKSPRKARGGLLVAQLTRAADFILPHPWTTAGTADCARLARCSILSSL